LREPLLDRRTFLRGAAATAAAAGTLGLGLRCDFPGFFSDTEFATLEALCDRLLPPDRDPGAAALGVPRYIEGLLTAFDRLHPQIFAGGPYSGRTPFPDYQNGTPSRRHPSNRFRRFLAMSPRQELFWRAELFGAVAAGLPAHLGQQRGGVLRGLRSIYPEGLARLDERAQTLHGQPFAGLDTALQDTLLQQLDAPGALPLEPVRDRTFLDIAIQHTLEGCFSAPEYGGNRDGRGWRMISIEGDSQPLGYSLFSRAIGGYREREGHPMSTPNADELGPDGQLVPRPLSADGLRIQTRIGNLTGFLDQVIPGACQ